MATEVVYAHWNSLCAAGKHPATPAHSGTTYDGFKADMWSVGVVAFELLTGHVPFPLGKNGLMSHAEFAQYNTLDSGPEHDVMLASYLQWNKVHVMQCCLVLALQCTQAVHASVCTCPAVFCLCSSDVCTVV